MESHVILKKSPAVQQGFEFLNFIMIGFTSQESFS
jgi:hypothetical protein